MDLSIVTSMYLSAPYLEQFYHRVSAAAEKITSDYELIFVNDGSPDHSLEIALDLYKRDARVKVIDLSRNFGHHKAILAGLHQAHGERVFMIDADLEEHPEWLTDFSAEFDNNQVDVIFGVERERNGTFLNRWGGGIFYKIFNLLSDTPIPQNPCTVRLMSQDFVKALLTMHDKNVFLAGNFSWVGFKQRKLPVQKDQGKRPTTYTVGKMLKLFVDALTSFTSYPLSLIFFTGLIIATISGAMGFQMAIHKWLNPNAVILGYSSIMVSVWFLGGLSIAFLGIIGIYLGKVFTEVKDRPEYIIRQIYRREANG